jgi:hypothetical protein
MRRALLPLLPIAAAICAGTHAAAQQRAFCGVGGLRLGSNLFFEAGLGVIGRAPDPTPSSRGVSVSVEVDPIATGVVGAVGSAWADILPFCGALSLGYYTDGHRGEPRLKPELGFGIMGYRITYGHSFRLGPGTVSGINSDELVMHFVVPFAPLFDEKPAR